MARREGRCAVYSPARPDHGLNAVCGADLEGTRESRRRERMSVEPDEQRPVDALPPTILADGLTDREHMKFVETRVEGAAAMAGGAEGNTLRGNRGVRPLAVIGGNEPRNVDQRCGRRVAAR